MQCFFQMYKITLKISYIQKPSTYNIFVGFEPEFDLLNLSIFQLTFTLCKIRHTNSSNGIEQSTHDETTESFRAAKKITTIFDIVKKGLS